MTSGDPGKRFAVQDPHASKHFESTPPPYSRVSWDTQTHNLSVAESRCREDLGAPHDSVPPRPNLRRQSQRQLLKNILRWALAWGVLRADTTNARPPFSQHNKHFASVLRVQPKHRHHNGQHARRCRPQLRARYCPLILGPRPSSGKLLRPRSLNSAGPLSCLTNRP